MGGLGDQINQFIFGKYLSKKFKYIIYYDLTYYLKSPLFNFKLREFNIPEKFENKFFFKLPYKYISLLRYIPRNKILFKFLSNNKIENFYYENWKNNEPLNEKKIINKTIFFGYWHNKKYFFENKKILNKILKLKNISANLKKIILQIKSDDVAIHVRGKDFLNNSHALELKEEYYKKAIVKFLDLRIKGKFYVFTDDPMHAKKILSNIKLIKPIFVYKYKFKDIEEFELMKKFRYLILSNSTFGWTASLINIKTKKIIIPRYWYKGIKNINNRKITKMITI